MKTARRAFLILSLSTFVMFLFECGINENILVAETNTGVDVGQKAPAFELLTIEDKKLELESIWKG